MNKHEKIESHEIELRDILNEFDVSNERKILTQHNLKWLHRNIGIKNSKHIKFHRAMRLIIDLNYFHENK